MRYLVDDRERVIEVKKAFRVINDTLDLERYFSKFMRSKVSYNLPVSSDSSFDYMVYNFVVTALIPDSFDMISVNFNYGDFKSSDSFMPYLTATYRFVVNNPKKNKVRAAIKYLLSRYKALISYYKVRVYGSEYSIEIRTRIFNDVVKLLRSLNDIMLAYKSEDHIPESVFRDMYALALKIKGNIDKYVSSLPTFVRNLSKLVKMINEWKL